MRIEDIEVGKIYRIRQWDDMANEFPVSGDSIILTDIAFLEKMEPLCGKKCYVKSKDCYDNSIFLDFINYDGDTDFIFTSEMIEHIEEDKDIEKRCLLKLNPVIW